MYLKHVLSISSLFLALHTLCFADGDHSSLFGEFLSIRHDHPVTHAAISPDGSRLLSISDDLLKIWDARTGGYIAGIDGEIGGYIERAAFSPDGEHVLILDGSSIARVWDVDRGNWFLFLVGHQDSIFTAEYSHDGNYIVTTSSDTTIKIWDAHTGELLSSIYEMASAAIFSADDQTIISTSNFFLRVAKVWGLDGLLISSSSLWDEILPIPHPVEDGDGCIPGNEEHANCAPPSVPIVDVPVVVTPPGVPSVGVPVSDLPQRFPAISVSGRYFGFNDWSAEIRSIDDNFQTKYLFHDTAITSLSFSDDERYALTASLDGTAKIWNIETGEGVLHIHGHTAAINSASLSRDGRWVVTASEDKTLKVWNVSFMQ